MPLLHQPTILKDVAAGLHHRDGHFADVVLTICALGSRFSSDPRSLDTNAVPGWHYFRQVRLSPNMAVPVTLYQLQASMV